MTHLQKEKFQFCGSPWGEGVEQEAEGLESQENFALVTFKMSASAGHTHFLWPFLQ